MDNESSKDCHDSWDLSLAQRLLTGQELKNESVSGSIHKRGSVLSEAINVINGDRQNVYGSPEDSFKLIAHYWNIYLQHMNKPVYAVEARDVAIMMTLFKIAREANQHKRDNIIDAAGYLGIYADMYA